MPVPDIGNQEEPTRQWEKDEMGRILAMFLLLILAYADPDAPRCPYEEVGVVKVGYGSLTGPADGPETPRPYVPELVLERGLVRTALSRELAVDLLFGPVRYAITGTVIRFTDPDCTGH